MSEFVGLHREAPRSIGDGLVLDGPALGFVMKLCTHFTLIFHWEGISVHIGLPGFGGCELG